MRLLLQIHDELVLECPEAASKSMAEIVREEMERAIPLRVPLKAEAGIGADWLSAK
jgi:DNA polymerase-1